MYTVKEIHIMPYSHHDFAWTNSRQWHIHRYIQIFVEVLDIMRENDDFTWMIDNVAHSLIPFIRHCPERVEEFKRRVKEGRIYVANGGFSLARSTYVGDETFIRNMIEGKRFFHSFFDIDNIEFFFNADVGCGHSQLPQVLQLAGHKYYRFQRPEDALDAKKVPRQFVWEGLDGSRIIVSRGTYSGFAEAKFTGKDFDHEWGEVKREFFAEDLHDKINDLLAADIVWLNWGDDDSRPLRNLHDEPIDVLKFIEAWNAREACKLRRSTPDVYFEKLKQHDLPVHAGVLDPCELSFNAAFRGGRSMWRIRGELDRLLVRAESLAAFASLIGTAYPHDKLEALWRQLFEVTGHAIEWVYREDFDDLYSIAAGAKSTAQTLIGELKEELAMKLQVSPGSQYVIFNTAGFKRAEIVEMQVTHTLGMTGFDLYDSQGQKIDYQIIGLCDEYKKYPSCEFNAVYIVAEVAVPAMGYAGITAVRNGKRLEDKVKADYIDVLQRLSAPDTVVIDNGTVEVTIERGWVSGIREKATGNVIKASSSNRIHSLRFVRTEVSPGWVAAWEPLDEYEMIPETWELVENGPLRWMYRVSGRIGNSSFKLDLSLRKGERAIAFDLDLDSAEEEGYFIVDFPADPDTSIYADIPFGVEERDVSRETYKSVGSKYDYNSFERGWAGQFYARSWALFQCSEMPVAIVSENGSIYYNHDRERNAVSFLLNRSVPVEGKEQRWLRNIHPSIDGKGVHQYKYSLYFPEGEGKYSDIVRFSKMKAQPVEVAAKYNGESDKPLPLGKAFIEIDCEYVMVSAFYKEGENYVLRLYETEGRSSTVGITADFNFTGATLVDLLGHAIDQGAMTTNPDQHRLSVRIKPWQIVNIRMKALAEKKEEGYGK